uniref:Ig-like domain-containing protein n=1 Tax=Oncorhynchus tshawytscha TaxID=74940 RepID=A0A8C8FFH6_ONCTS
MMALCLILALLVEMAAAQSLEMHLIMANVGETVTLHCFYKGNLALYLMWYKQTMGDNPQLLLTFYKYNKNATFYHEFKGNTHFSVQSGEGMNHLKISDMQLSDSATYYCGNSYANQVEFGAGVILTVKGTTSEFTNKGNSNSFSALIMLRDFSTLRLGYNGLIIQRGHMETVVYAGIRQ